MLTRDRRLQPEGSMWTSRVVVREPFTEALEMTLLKDKDPVVALAPSRADLTLDVRIGLGAAIGALITSMPSAWKTRSEPPPYLASQRYHDLALSVAVCLEARGNQAGHSTESDRLVKSLSVYLTTALTCGQSTWVVGSDSLKRGRAMAWGWSWLSATDSRQLQELVQTCAVRRARPRSSP